MSGSTWLFLSGSRYWNTGKEFIEFHSGLPGTGRLVSFYDLKTPKAQKDMLEDVLDLLTQGDKERTSNAD